MSDEPENFANAPLSITELRANKERDGALWTPRDALISVLRDLDAGKINPNYLAIVWNDVLENGNAAVQVTASSAGIAGGFLAITGMLCRALHIMNAKQ